MLKNLILFIIITLQEVQRRLSERSRLIERRTSESPGRAIGFFGACKIPGVIEYSFSLFFSKLVSYTFLYWLPLYVHASSKCSVLYKGCKSDFGSLVLGVSPDKYIYIT